MRFPVSVPCTVTTRRYNFLSCGHQGMQPGYPKNPPIIKPVNPAEFDGFKFWVSVLQRTARINRKE